MFNNKCNCGCNQPFMAGSMPSPAPIVAPKKVCVSQSNRYIEQPVICPIECRHVQNLMYYPRYYPRYEQTYVTRDTMNAYAANGTAMPFSGVNAGASAYGATETNTFATKFGNSFNNGCGK